MANQKLPWTCPECGKYMALMSNLASRQQESHRTGKDCAARTETNRALGRGLVCLSHLLMAHDRAQDLNHALSVAGLLEYLPTLYQPSGYRGGRLHARAVVDDECWAPAWARNMALHQLPPAPETWAELFTITAAAVAEADLPLDEQAKLFLP